MKILTPNKLAPKVHPVFKPRYMLEALTRHPQHRPTKTARMVITHGFSGGRSSKGRYGSRMKLSTSSSSPLTLMVWCPFSSPWKESDAGSLSFRIGVLKMVESFSMSLPRGLEQRVSSKNKWTRLPVLTYASGLTWPPGAICLSRTSVVMLLPRSAWTTTITARVLESPWAFKFQGILRSTTRGLIYRLQSKRTWASRDLPCSDGLCLTGLLMAPFTNTLPSKMEINRLVASNGVV